MQTDHLGSYERITDQSQRVVQQTHYDPWGCRMLAGNWQTVDTATSHPFRRGFTGHEHYDRFRLVNAGARLYDPLIARFLAPDPQVQNPYSTQSLNRYTYCANNPTTYTDPTGEYFILDAGIAGFIHGLSEGKGLMHAMNTALRMMRNDFDIWAGLFYTDENKSFGGRVWALVSRFTWQAPQTLMGLATSLTANMAEGLGFENGGVRDVGYKYGATAVSFKVGHWGAMTLGNYIMGGPLMEADANNSIFQHEYGHYIQSQRMGPLYLSEVALPSALSLGNHNTHPIELDANRRAFLYFNEYVNGFYKSQTEWDDHRGWDFIKNPLYKGVLYVDYNLPNTWELLSPDGIDGLFLVSGFFLGGWLGLGVGYLMDSFYNTLYYNQNQ